MIILSPRGNSATRTVVAWPTYEPLTSRYYRRRTREHSSERINISDSLRADSEGEYELDQIARMINIDRFLHVAWAVDTIWRVEKTHLQLCTPKTRKDAIRSKLLSPGAILDHHTFDFPYNQLDRIWSVNAILQMDKAKCGIRTGVDNICMTLRFVIPWNTFLAFEVWTPALF